MKRRRNGGEVRKDRGVIVNRTSGTSLFLSERRQKGGGDSSLKYLTFHLSDWQTHTHTHTHTHKQSNSNLTHANVQPHTYAKVCTFVCEQVSREQHRNSVKVNNMAGRVLTSRRRRPEEMTVLPVGWNDDRSHSCIHTHIKTNKGPRTWKHKQECMLTYTHTVCTFICTQERSHTDTNSLTVSLGVCSECLCLLHMWPHA